MNHHSSMNNLPSQQQQHPPKSFCNNCGKPGHSFHQCKLPITSYGIVLFRHHPEKGLQFLMIRRKDSFGYIDLIRGKYSPHHSEQIQQSVDEMSTTEKQRLLNFPFDELWRQLWGDNLLTQYKNQEIAAAKKFEIIKRTLQSHVEASPTQWEETEWEFPKGRRNPQESDLDCALREFEEETGIQREKVRVFENVLPFEEVFIGSNHKSYKHKFFLAMTSFTQDNDDEWGQNFQQSEVSKIEWKTLDKCLQSIRPYHHEKKKLIHHIHHVLQEYAFF